MKLRSSRKLLLALAIMALWAAPALAIPEIQLYVEGANFDASTQTWVTNSRNFRLWLIGNVGATGSILDLHITAAYLTGEAGSINLTPTTTSLLADGSMPSAPVVNESVGANGTIPVMDGGSYLPSHGTYGAGVSFKQFDVGDLNLTDSPIGDFSGALAFPNIFSSVGQINAYDVSITGHSMVQFDAFNHLAAQHKVMSIASETNVVPEPASLLLLGLGLGGSALLRRRRAKP